MTEKNKYIAFCEKNEEKISIFLHPWWLDIVSDEHEWNVVIYEENDSIIAAIPFIFIKKATLKYIQTPPLTPAIGLYLDHSLKGGNHKIINKQRKVITFLIDQLPRFDVLLMKITGEVLDWRPFHWKGFEQSTFYSSRIRNSVNPELLLSNYKSNLRRDIKKGETHLKISESTDENVFYELITSSYRRKGQEPSFSEDAFFRIFRETQNRGLAYSILTKDENRQNVGCLFCVEDIDAIYYLFGGIDSNLNTRGSQSMLVHQAILASLSKNKDFDFEGSMNQGIDRFFMSYSPELFPYHRISKSNSKLFDIKKAIF